MLEPMITVLIESKKSAIDKEKFKCRFIGHVFVQTQVKPSWTSMTLNQKQHGRGPRGDH